MTGVRSANATDNQREMWLGEGGILQKKKKKKKKKEKRKEKKRKTQTKEQKRIYSSQSARDSGFSWNQTNPQVTLSDKKEKIKIHPR